MTPYIKNIVTICLQHMTHDPNYTYDDDTESTGAAADEKMSGGEEPAAKSEDADADWYYLSQRRVVWCGVGRNEAFSLLAVLCCVLLCCDQGR